MFEDLSEETTICVRARSQPLSVPPVAPASDSVPRGLVGRGSSPSTLHAGEASNLKDPNDLPAVL